jgi:integrase
MAEYRRQIERRAIPCFGRLRLAEIEPRDVKRYIAAVEAEGVSANTVRLALAPVKALLATARDEGVIRWNPAEGVRAGTAARTDADEERVKALTSEELRSVLDHVVPRHTVLAEFLASTGLRISEAVALRWIEIDLSARRVSVRRRWYAGSFAPPKSRYGRRDVSLSAGMTERLGALWRDRREGGEALVFPGRNGAPLDPSVAFRAVKAAAVKAGVPWAGLHTLRHTAASMLFARGENPKAIQRWLGHHRASFTLDTYVHLLDEQLPDGLDLARPPVGTDRRVTSRTSERSQLPAVASRS